MWVYRVQGPDYTVGYYVNDLVNGIWFEVCEVFSNQQEARDAVHYLNGGSHKTPH